MSDWGAKLLPGLFTGSNAPQFPVPPPPPPPDGDGINSRGYTFDSSSLEKAAEAAKELEKSRKSIFHSFQ